MYQRPSTRPSRYTPKWAGCESTVPSCRWMWLAPFASGLSPSANTMALDTAYSSTGSVGPNASFGASIHPFDTATFTYG